VRPTSRGFLRRGSQRETEHFPCSRVLAPTSEPVQPLPSCCGNYYLIFVALCLLWSECAAVPKPMSSRSEMDFRQVADAAGQKLLDLKVRPLFVDTRLKEYTTGTPHELTDRLFVVRRAFA